MTTTIDIPQGEPVADGTPPEAVATAIPRVFRELLANTLVTGVTSTFLWFALTFWVYLETRSVVATGVIGGAFSISSAVLSPLFGNFVDRHRKQAALVATTATSLLCFAVATAVFVTVDSADLLRLGSPWFWLLVGSTLLGSVGGQMRGIVLSTCVTLLVPDEQRDRANGMVGTITGVSFAVTSVFSGLVIGGLGMGWAYYASLGLTVAALGHVAKIRIDEPRPDLAAVGSHAAWGVDVRGAVDAIRAVPGLTMLILLAAFNNLLAGVFMALMDAYGLSLVSVEAWGLLWGAISLAFVAGGLVVARRGLGRNPLRAVLAANLVNWAVCSVFALQSSIVILAVGMVVWLALIPVIEAGEQTILQRSIAYERQGRVFGFAQLVENAASPLTAFLMAPIAEAVVIPFMTDGSGARWIGEWFGTGPERGIALMFTLAGLLGVGVTVRTWRSRSYRRLALATATPGSTDASSTPRVVALRTVEDCCAA
ncbi:MAG TPA: MFS transporter [Acidimicrobiales bacterium]|nr:MFS transporter [Acidimicrobiales bacterium]